MKLSQAFSVVRGDVVALVGAGGKTSALIALGHELAESGLRVLATTTTSIGQDQLALMPYTVPPDDRTRLSDALSAHRFVFVLDDVRNGQVYGPPPSIVSWMLDSLDADVLLVETDNANGLPFKAPKPDEPVIPPETTLAVPVAALSVLGQPLDDEHVYNPQAMIDRYGFYEGLPVKSPWVAQVVRDEALGLKGIPDAARVLALLNAVPPKGYHRGRARLIARLILRNPRVSGVALASVRASDPVHEVQRPIGAVVLAAGMSSRMGTMKMLLPWGHQTIIEHIVEQLILSRVDHIVVVTGNRADEVRALVEPLDVSVVYNDAYQTGEMASSLKAGLSAMPPHIAAALVVLGDQPRMQPKTVFQVMMAYAEGRGDIVAPSFNMRRGHPILIDRRYWRDLLHLPDGGTPRDVINANADRIAYVNVDNDSVLGDVDTPQDYRRERRNAGLSHSD